MSVAIVPMSIRDYEEVFQLWESSDGVGLSASDSRAALDRFLERNPGLSLVARNPEGRLIGAVLCSHDGIRGYIRHLAVAPVYRRQGIGRRLVGAATRALADLGIGKCSAFIFTGNRAGKRFYEGSGWFERQDLCVMQCLLQDGDAPPPPAD
jgi:putative acetyltransferase